VLCLVVAPLPPGENPFAVKINNNNNNNTILELCNVADGSLNCNEDQKRPLHLQGRCGVNGRGDVTCVFN
jgi:hypothetical protein